MNVRGFTLFELLLVIVISGILAVILGPIITEPVRGYFDVSRRADLVENAEQAMRRMTRDVRNSLPYSVRVGGGGTALEMLNVLDAGRYRTGGGGPGLNASVRLAFNNPDDEFNLTGRFTRLGKPFTSSGEHLVIFNLGAGNFDAYDGDPVIYSGGFTVSDDAGLNEDHVTLTAAHQFPASSPSQRIFIVNEARGYQCTGGQLVRYSGYGFDSTLPPGNFAGGAVMVDNVTNCTFNYDPGNSTRPGLLSLELTLTRDGESVRLLHQVHVSNAI